jgi:curved DNA-binding protein
MTTHYETLGVGENFTADELKKAYRRLASQHHPDKGGDTKRFQEIQTAYDTLSDPNRRQQYDMQRQGGGPGGVRFHWHTNDGNMPNDIGEIFRNFGFGGGDPFGQFRQQQPKRNKDLRIELPVTLASTLEEQRKTISVQTSNGHRETVEVNIPRGISNGNNIRYSGLGDNLFNTIPRGDLYVQISVLNDNNFAINGIDLYTKTSVNCFVATVGGKTNITTLDGKMYELTIPPGAQPGIKFRLSGQGLYEINSSRRGDLFVELGVTVPQNLSPEQLETVRSLINKQ